jgi:hypothetical protein
MIPFSGTKPSLTILDGVVPTPAIHPTKGSENVVAQRVQIGVTAMCVSHSLADGVDLPRVAWLGCHIGRFVGHRTLVWSIQSILRLCSIE